MKKKVLSILGVLLISISTLTGCAKCIDKKEESVKLSLIHIQMCIRDRAYVNLICTDKTGTLTTGEMTSTVMINGNCQDIFNKESSLNELIEDVYKRQHRYIL